MATERSAVGEDAGRPLRVAQAAYALRCGGVGSILLDIGRELTRAGFEVDLFATQERGGWFERAAADAGMRAHAILRGELLSRAAHAVRVGRTLARLRYDAILLHHCEPAQAAMRLLPNRMAVFPVLHSPTEPMLRTGCAARDAWNALIVPSERIEDAARMRAGSRPVVRIPHGVALDPSALEQARAKKDRPLVLAYVGRVEEALKGVLLLPEILAQVQAAAPSGRAARLRIAGDGPDAARLREKARALGVADSIDWLGELDREAARNVYRGAHALLLASRIEGMSVSILEAQASGCVPIATEIRGVTDQSVVPGRSGWLVPRDASAFARAVASVDADREGWLRMAAEAHRTVAERFTVERMGRDYANLVRDAAAGRYPLPRPRRRIFPLEPSLVGWKDYLPESARTVARRVRGGILGGGAPDERVREREGKG
ncbi:MAG: glycosyltransferase family 4 protein [Candidatus Eisenbacteria bacterium]